MRLRIRLSFVFALCFASGTTALAKQWRGIFPLRSTKSDVVRLLNKCSDAKNACFFATDSEDVYILFSSGLKEESTQCGSNLSPETVIFIEVRPHAPLTLNGLRLDKRQLEAFNVPASFERRLKAYRTKDGLIASTLLNRVLQLDYIAAPNADGACRDYYDDVQPFVQTLAEHPPPTILLNCDRHVAPGETFSLWGTFIVTRRGFTWRVNGGTIVAGQGTHGVSIATTGEPGQKLKVSVEFEDAFRRATTTQCEIPIVGKALH